MSWDEGSSYHFTIVRLVALGMGCASVMLEIPWNAPFVKRRFARRHYQRGRFALVPSVSSVFPCQWNLSLWLFPNRQPP